MTRRLVPLATALSALLLAGTGCARERPGPAPTGEDATSAGTVRRLAERLTGRFSSEDQARSEVAAPDLRLAITRIWPERRGELWLYLELSRSDAMDSPDRQQVLELVPAGPDWVEIRAWDLPDPEAWIGAWSDEEPLAALDPAGLLRNADCTILVREASPGTFAGGTPGPGCTGGPEGPGAGSVRLEVGPGGIDAWPCRCNAAGPAAGRTVSGPIRLARREDWPVGP